MMILTIAAFALDSSLYVNAQITAAVRADSSKIEAEITKLEGEIAGLLKGLVA